MADFIFCVNISKTEWGGDRVGGVETFIYELLPNKMTYPNKIYTKYKPVNGNAPIYYTNCSDYLFKMLSMVAR